MKLFGKKKINDSGFGLDTLIGYLVLFGIAIIVVALFFVFNKIA